MLKHYKYFFIPVPTFTDCVTPKDPKTIFLAEEIFYKNTGLIVTSTLSLSSAPLLVDLKMPITQIENVKFKMCPSAPLGAMRFNR